MMHFRAIITVAIVQYLARVASSSSTKAWQPPSETATFDQWCPECALPEVRQRPSRALCLSGGGTRAYAAAVGQLRGIYNVDMAGDFRYIMAVSGGAWFVISAAFDQSGTAVEDLLGPAVQPQALTRAAVEAKIDPRELLQSATNGLLNNNVVNFGKSLLGFEKSVDIYVDSLYETFLKNRKLDKGTLFSWSEASIADIKQRNPALEKTRFVPVGSGFPFPVVGMSLLGPERFLPFGLSTNYSCMEATPLYIGQEHSRNTTFVRYHHPTSKETVLVGGLIEPFAFGSSAPPQRLSPGQAEGILDPTLPPRLFALENLMATSSWAPGGVLSQYLPALERYLYTAYNYWSPVSQGQPHQAHRAGRDGDGDGDGDGRAVKGAPLIFADGGIIDNFHLIGALKRQIREIVIAVNTNTPLRGDWNVTTDKYTGAEIDDSFISFFGVTTKFSLEDLVHNQVFPREYAERFVAGLQAAQATGNGAVVRMDLPVMPNKYHGVVGGFTATVTCIYLGRAMNWENALPSELSELVRPTKHPEHAWSLTKRGPLKHFPHASTADLTLSPMWANMLAHLTHWVVTQNQHLIVPRESV